MTEAEATVPEREKPAAVRAVATSAPISTVSRIALQETIAEISASARQTRDASSLAWRWLRLGAERRLGIEVNVDDPALRELFGHLLQVEGLLGEVRSQAYSLIQGTSLLAEGHSNGGVGLAGLAGGAGGSSTASTQGGGAQAATLLAESLTLLASRAGTRARLTASAASDASVGSSTEGGSAGSTAVPRGRLCGDAPAIVANAVWHTVSMSPNASDSGSARYRMERRLCEEVFEPVENQLKEHDRLRDCLRERDGWRQQLTQCQREVAKLRKVRRSSLAEGIADNVGKAATGVAVAAGAAGVAGSGLRPLVTGSARLGAAACPCNPRASAGNCK